MGTSSQRACATDLSARMRPPSPCNAPSSNLAGAFTAARARPVSRCAFIRIPRHFLRVERDGRVADGEVDFHPAGADVFQESVLHGGQNPGVPVPAPIPVE